MILFILYCSKSFEWSAIIPILAFIVSIIALLTNVKNSNRNVNLAIQQAIFKTISEKAKDCNTLWEAEDDRHFENAVHFKVMSELIITTEIIDKSVKLFSRNSDSIVLLKEEFYWLFWKQLRTDLRGWIKRTPQIVNQLEPKNEIYSQQVANLYSKVEKHFE